MPDLLPRVVCSFIFAGFQQAVALTTDQYGAQLRVPTKAPSNLRSELGPQAFLHSGLSIRSKGMMPSCCPCERRLLQRASRIQPKSGPDWISQLSTGLDLVIPERSQCQAISWLQRRARDLMRSDAGLLPFLQISCRVKVTDSMQNLGAADEAECSCKVSRRDGSVNNQCCLCGPSGREREGGRERVCRDFSVSHLRSWAS